MVAPDVVTEAGQHRRTHNSRAAGPSSSITMTVTSATFCSTDDFSKLPYRGRVPTGTRNLLTHKSTNIEVGPLQHMRAKRFTNASKLPATDNTGHVRRWSHHGALGRRREALLARLSPCHVALTWRKGKRNPWIPIHTPVDLSPKLVLCAVLNTPCTPSYCTRKI